MRARPRRKGAVPLPPQRVLTWVPPEVPLLRGVQGGLIGLILLCFGVSVWWWDESRILNKTAERFEAGAARTEILNRQFEASLKRESLTLAGDQIALIQGKIAFANQLTEKRSFSWTRLLSELEETVPAQVSVGSVKLDFHPSRIMLDGVAASLQDVNVFVRALQHHQAFQSAVLVKHEEHKKQQGSSQAQTAGGESIGNGPRIEFSLTIGYRGVLLNEEGAL
ncbi:MAG TPA: PilN domain-containing protein [Nitrospira sp.]